MLNFSLKKLISFSKSPGFFLILSFFLIIFILQFYAKTSGAKQVLFALVISSVNLYFCQGKFQATEDKFFNPFFFIMNGIGIIVFFSGYLFWHYMIYFSGLSADNVIMIALKYRVLLAALSTTLGLSVITGFFLKKPQVEIVESAKQEYIPSPIALRISTRVKRKMGIFKYNKWFIGYTVIFSIFLSLIGYSKRRGVFILPHMIECAIMPIMAICYTIFLLGTGGKIYYICYRTVRKEQQMEERQKKKKEQKRCEDE